MQLQQFLTLNTIVHFFLKDKSPFMLQINHLSSLYWFLLTEFSSSFSIPWDCLSCHLLLGTVSPGDVTFHIYAQLCSFTLIFWYLMRFAPMICISRCRDLWFAPEPVDLGSFHSLIFLSMALSSSSISHSTYQKNCKIYKFYSEAPKPNNIDNNWKRRKQSKWRCDDGLKKTKTIRIGFQPSRLFYCIKHVLPHYNLPHIFQLYLILKLLNMQGIH